MKFILPSPGALTVAASLALLAASAHPEGPRHPKFGFPLYTNQPAGRQTTGQHAAAGTPALSPAEAQKKFQDASKDIEMAKIAADVQKTQYLSMAASAVPCKSIS